MVMAEILLYLFKGLKLKWGGLGSTSGWHQLCSIWQTDLIHSHILGAVIPRPTVPHINSCLDWHYTMLSAAFTFSGAIFPCR